MTAKKSYESTVMRIAGNLLSGEPLAPNGVLNGGYEDATEEAFVRLAVRRARLIVAEVERTEPAASSVDQKGS